MAKEAGHFIPADGIMSGTDTMQPTVEIEMKPVQKKEISTFHASTILVTMIGSSGIFIASGAFVEYAGSVGLTLILVAVSAVINVALALCFVEVALILPKAGGPYFFVLDVFGRFPAFIFVWGFILLIACPVWALMAYTASLYMIKLGFPGCHPPDVAVKLLGSCILVVVVLLNCMYLKYVTKAQAFLVSTKLIAMGMIVIAGLVKIAQDDTALISNMFEGTTTKPGNIALGVLTGMFIFGGWQIIMFLLEDIKKPSRDVPRALYISFTIITILYEFTVLAYCVVLSPAELLSSNAVAVNFMERLYDPLAPLISILVASTSIGSLNAVTLAHSRLMLAVARNGQLPRLLAMVSQKYLMPWPASFVMCILSVLVLISGTFGLLIDMVSFYACVMSAFVLSCLFYLRWKRPDSPRPIKVPLGIVIFQFVLNLAVMLLSLYQKPQEIGIAIAIICFGIPVYLLGIQWKSKPKSFLHFIDKITGIVQKTFLLEAYRVS